MAYFLNQTSTNQQLVVVLSLNLSKVPVPQLQVQCTSAEGPSVTCHKPKLIAYEMEDSRDNATLHRTQASYPSARQGKVSILLGKSLSESSLLWLAFP